jgi:hypothetical protein
MSIPGVLLLFYCLLMISGEFLLTDSSDGFQNIMYYLKSYNISSHVLQPWRSFKPRSLTHPLLFLMKFFRHVAFRISSSGKKDA